MLKWLTALAMMVLTSMAPAIAYSSSSIPAKAETVQDFSGKWTVRWVSNDSRNPISLAQNATNFTGQYRNDAKEYCAVSGDLDPVNRFIKLLIQCPKWDIKMEGFPTLDGSTIVGKYLAYGKAGGGFIMTKE